MKIDKADPPPTIMSLSEASNQVGTGIFYLAQIPSTSSISCYVTSSNSFDCRYKALTEPGDRAPVFENFSYFF